MKIRSRFVANSSSSSFIVVFPRKPESQDDVRTMVFGKKEHFVSPFEYGLYWTTQEIAKDIWEDIQNQEPNDYKQMLNEYETDLSYEEFEYKDEHGKLQYDWQKYEHEEMRLKEVELDKWLRENKTDESYIYIFEYEDHDDYHAALEHGDLFKKLKHIRNNKH